MQLPNEAEQLARLRDKLGPHACGSKLLHHLRAARGKLHWAGDARACLVALRPDVCAKWPDIAPLLLLPTFDEGQLSTLITTHAKRNLLELALFLLLEPRVVHLAFVVDTGRPLAMSHSLVLPLLMYTLP